MPYTNPWSVTEPPVGALANTLGIEGRQLRLDLQERLESALIVDMDADPVVIRDQVAGVRENDQWVIPACSFLSDLTLKQNAMDVEAGKIGVFAGHPSLWAPLPATLKGCTIKLVEWLVDINDVVSLDMVFMSRSFANSPAAASAINSKNIAAPGANIVNGGAFSHTVDASRQYFFKVTANGTTDDGAWVYAVRVTFDRPA